MKADNKLYQKFASVLDATPFSVGMENVAPFPRENAHF